MKEDKLSYDEEIKLKTLCEYLISNNLDSITDFTNFQNSLNPLIENNNNLQNIYDCIVGNKKYLTYTRLYYAYLKYKNENNENNDTSKFFKKITETIKIVDKKSVSVGIIKKQRDLPINFLDTDKFTLTKISVCKNTNEEIIGLILEYMDENNEKYHLRLTSTDVIIKTIDIELQKKVYLNKEIRDSITHIFGTLNKQQDKITSIGFKCSSGNLFYHGIQDVKPFLFGCYGQKLQFLDLSFNDNNQISGLKVYFKYNEESNKNIKFKEKEELYFDEKLLKDGKNKELRNIRIFSLGRENAEKFEEENIFLEPDLITLNNRSVIFDTKIISNEFLKNSTVVEEGNKNYSTNHNPFFDLNENPNVNINNPFYPENKRYQKGEEKNKQINAKRKMNMTVIYDLNQSIKEQFVRKISEKMKNLENKKKLFTIKDEIISNINDRICEILKDIKEKKENKIEEIDIDQEIQDALEYLFKNNINEDIKNDDEEIIKFLCEKLGENYENYENEKNEIINNNIKKLNEKENILNEGQNKDITEKIEGIEKKFDNIKTINQNDRKNRINNIFEMIKLIMNLNGMEIEINNMLEKEKKKNQDINSNINDNIDNNEINELDERLVKQEDNNINANKKENIKNLNNLNNKYFKMLNAKLVNQIVEYQEEFKNERREAMNKQFNGFEIIEKEEFNENLNILLKSFYNKKIKEGAKIKKNDRKNFPKSLRKWEDNSFKSDTALGKKLSKKIKWSTPDETKNYFIIRNEPKIQNIQQSKYINDCFFLAALGSLCNKNKENNNIIKDLFHITNKTKEHAYGIYFYINGKRTLILLDDYLAYDNKNNLYFSSSYDKEELWVSLIEKAFAKVKGGYNNLDRGFSKEAFEYLTGAYTKQIKKNRIDRDSLWERLKESKDYPMCAGTDITFDFFSNLNLKDQHEYTITNVFEENGRKVTLRDPYGSKKIHKSGAKTDEFTISFDNFYKKLFLLEINYFQKGFKDNFFKIKKEESLRMQIFKLNIEEEEGNEVSINLYQKNKYIPVYSYLMLIKKNESNDNNDALYEYEDSTTSLINIGEYDGHIALNNKKLEKGEYYICCDNNYRFLDKSVKNENIHSYNLNIFSKNKIKVENITEQLSKIERIKIFKDALFSIIKKEKINSHTYPYKFDNNNNYKMEVKLLNNKDLFPFDVFYFENNNDSSRTIKFNLYSNKNYCFYNDINASEFDKSLIKEIEKNQHQIITIMNFKYFPREMETIKDYLKYKISEKLDKNNNHYVFEENEENKTIIGNSKGKVEVYKKKIGGNGLILGFKNITNKDLNLKISSENWFITDSKEWNYNKNDFVFQLNKGENKVFNLRKRIGKEKWDCFIYII